MVDYIDAKGTVIGEISIPINSKSFHYTGRYEHKDLPEIVKENKITEFFIPSIWPKTFSYTTEEIMLMRYPLTVFNIGDPAERVRHYELGRVIEVN